MNLTATQIEAIREWADTATDIRADYLFGSRAKGTARKDSDANIALEFFAEDNEVTRLFFLNDDGWQDDLRRRTGLEVNIAHLAGIFTPMHCQAVADDGVELYR